MQSGRGKTKCWVLEYERDSKRGPESIMGWTSSGDTLNQVRLRFDSSEHAVEYAQKKGWDFVVLPEHERIVRPRNYGDNFKYIPPKADKKA